jgi:hypothetical protein
MNTYNASIYGNESASLTVRAASAIEAAKNLWVAIHGDRIGFSYAQVDQNAADLAARDNAHAQWMGGHAGIRVSRAAK